MSLRPWELDPMQKRIRRARIARRREARGWDYGDAGFMAFMVGGCAWLMIIIVLAVLRVEGYRKAEETAKVESPPPVVSPTRPPGARGPGVRQQLNPADRGDTE